jgi:hypothetical protein
MVGKGKIGTQIVGGILETQWRQKPRKNLKSRYFIKYNASNAKRMYICIHICLYEYFTIANNPYSTKTSLNKDFHILILTIFDSIEKSVYCDRRYNYRAIISGILQYLQIATFRKIRAVGEEGVFIKTEIRGIKTSFTSDLV